MTPPAFPAGSLAPVGCSGAGDGPSSGCDSRTGRTTGQPGGGVTHPEIPECLRNRPFDERRKLPVPYIHDALDGRWDFTALLSDRLTECIRQRICGQCAEPLGWWIAFIGGPVSVATRAYSDPPMHEECARAALRLCPHINRINMKRATRGSLPGERCEHSPDAILDRTTIWVLTITRGYDVVVQSNGAPLFIARTIKRKHGWRNREDGPGLIELSAAELYASQSGGER